VVKRGEFEPWEIERNRLADEIRTASRTLRRASELHGSLFFKDEHTGEVYTRGSMVRRMEVYAAVNRAEIALNRLVWEVVALLADYARGTDVLLEARRRVTVDD